MTMRKVGILDYGAGNFGSVKRALESLAVSPLSIVHEEDLEHVTHLIFPGVGSAAQAMSELQARQLDSALVRYARSGRPLLGICVGMQVLGQWSAEGDVPCLGLLPYKIDKFSCSEPIPHMGWNSLNWNRAHPMVGCASADLSESANFYFVHSYAAYVQKEDRNDTCVLASTEYGGQHFAALVAQNKIWGAQCHVEKSGRVGLKFIQNFLQLSAT